MKLDTINQKQLDKYLEQILSSDEFKNNDSNSLAADLGASIQNLFNMLWDKIKAFFNTIKLPDIDIQSAAASVPAPAAFIFNAVVFLIVISVVIVAIYLLIRLFRKDKAALIQEDEKILESIRDYGEVYNRAVVAATSKEYRQAVRLLFISLIINLNMKGIVKIEKAKTNRQYTREVFSNNQEIIEEFKEFVHLFEVHWYGNKYADESIYEKCLISFERICR